MHDDAVTEQLHRRLDRCRSSYRSRAIAARWSALHPALDGVGIDDIIEICRAGTTEQNPLVGALVELHQAGDDDATVLLLSVCRPVLFGIFHHTRRTADLDDREATHSANYWAALGHVLATLDPTPPVDSTGRPTPFLAHIGTAVFTTRKQLDASERRRHRYNRSGGGEDNRLITLTDEVVDDHHRRSWANEVHDVENQALCRIELARIGDAISSGAIPLDRWQRLVRHRIAHATSAPTAERVAVHRTANRLAHLVGHAA